MRASSPCRGLFAFLALTAALLAGPRDKEWEKVADACTKNQPRTAIALLRPLEAAAFADCAWAEGTKALLMRVRLENGLWFEADPLPEFAKKKATTVPPADPFGDPFAGHHFDDDDATAGGLTGCLRQLDGEMARVPAPVQAVLRVFEARWLVSYYRSQSSDWRNQTHIAAPPADPNALTDLAIWDAPRVCAAVHRIWQDALAAKEELRKIPVAEWSALFRPGTLDDALRPTLYDLIAHDAIAFLSNDDVCVVEEPFAVDADSPALGDAEAFIAWQPPAPEGESPLYQTLRIYQSLLACHRADADRSAFLHCNLERLRWLGEVAHGKNKSARHTAAIRAFITANASHPLSADARQDDVVLLLQKNRTKDAHDSAAAGAAAFPKHPFGRACRDLVRHFEEETLEFSTPSAWPMRGERVAIRQKNLGHVWFRIYQQDRQAPTDPFRNRSEITDRKQLAAILKTKPLRTWDAALPAERDYALHQAVIDSPGDLQPGFYLLVVSGVKDFNRFDEVMKWASIDVSNIGLAVVAPSSRDGRVAGVVVDVISGAPLGDVTVACWLNESSEELSGVQGGKEPKPPLKESPQFTTKSAADGTVEFACPLQRDWAKVMLVASSGGQRAVTGDAIYRNKNNTHSVAKVSLFTDRALYRPGQPIQFKGICCAADRAKNTYGTVSDRKLEVSLVGPDKNTCETREVTTNSLGSFSGTFAAPSNGLLGIYSIRAGEEGSQQIRIEEYKRPKFTVKLSPPTRPPAFGERIEIKGIACNYTGAPVDGAEVSWEVAPDSFFMGRSAWRYRDLPPLGSVNYGRGRDTLARGTTRTAADGSFTVAFPAERDERFDEAIEMGCIYRITVTATDLTGEAEDEMIDVNVGSANVDAKISVRGHDWQESNRPVEFEILTSTLDGEPQAVEGVLRIHKLREPATCPLDDGELFRVDQSLDQPLESADAWETGEVVREVPVKTQVAKSDAACVAKAAVDLTPGRYRAIFECRDTRGHKVEAITDLQVLDPNAERFPTKMPFFAGALNLTREPGEEFTMMWGSGLESVRACAEWCKDGVLLKREWSAPGRNQQTFTFTPDESMRGGISVRVTQFGMNRVLRECRALNIPWSNKQLALGWERITSKLEPGAKETWTAVIRGTDGAPATAEMVATLYDASLDALSSHDFDLWSWQTMFRLDTTDFGYGHGSFQYVDGTYLPPPQTNPYDRCESAWFSIKTPFRARIAAFGNQWTPRCIGMDYEGRYVDWNPNGLQRTLGITLVEFYEPPQLPQSGVGREQVAGAFPPAPSDGREARAALDSIHARRNLQETAFFYPHLTSGPDGTLRISFTMPEGLGKWRFLGFAHDAAMRFGALEGETLTAKDLMAQPNPPRFLREGDVLEFPVHISNQSEQEQTGVARLSLTDEAAGRDLTKQLGVGEPELPFRIPAKQSRTLSWRLTVPDGTGYIRYKALATCGSLSDGEEGMLPVLPRRVLVTESLALPIRDAGQKSYAFEKLRDSGKSDTLQHKFLDVQVVSQPAWYALMALPYLMEFPHECSEQTFHRYYANALGRHLVRSDPKLKQVFEAWRNTAALDSPLTKNQDIAGIMLDETPWLREANDESQARRRLGMLLEDGQLDAQLADTMAKLIGMQRANGMWPWFAGGPDSEFITLSIVTGFGRLRALGVDTDMTPVLKAVPALDCLLTERHRAIQQEAKKSAKVLDENHLDPWIACHLYARSYFLREKGPMEASRLDAGNWLARDYFLRQARQYWPQLRSRLAAAQLALALFRDGDAVTAKLITRSLRETAVRRADTGMSWRATDGDGWWWWEAPVESQAMAIEAFREIDDDSQAVEDCRVWLIQQKRLHDWQTTMATADAIHALLLGPAAGATPGNSLAPLLSPSDALLRVTLGGVPLEPRNVEAGTGFYQHRFAASEVTPAMADIVLTKTDPGVAWASVHWQYLEDLAKLTSHETTGLRLEKTMFVRRDAAHGKVLEPLSGPLRVGDVLVTRLLLRNERAMEFVHLKDARGSGTEPLNLLSGYRWQDGLGYYEVTRDAATHFFIDSLPAGTHVVETSARIQHAGVYQSGTAEIRCLYAPEFSAHSASVAIEVAR